MNVSVDYVGQAADILEEEAVNSAAALASNKTQIALACVRKGNMYAGTVPVAEKIKRRAKGKAQRLARKKSR